MKPVRGKRTANEYSRSASPLDEEKGSPPPYVHVSSYVTTGLLGHIVFLCHRAGGGGEKTLLGGGTAGVQISALPDLQHKPVPVM